MNPEAFTRRTQVGPVSLYLAATLFGTVLVSCANLNSKTRSNAEQWHQSTEGLTYFLPMRVVKVTATRAPLDPVKITAELEKAKVSQAALASKAKELKALADNATKVAMDPGLSPEAKVKAVQDGQLKSADAAVAGAELAGISLTVQGLEVLKQQALLGADCTYDIKLEILPPQANPANAFTVDLSHNWFRDDVVKLTVTPAGLLSSANVVATDRTGDVLIEAAGAISGLTSGQAPMIAGLPRPSTCTDPTAPRRFVYSFDPTTEGEKVNVELILAKFPFRVEVLDVAANPAKAPTTPDFGADQSGLFYQTPVPYRLVVRQCANAPCLTGDNGALLDSATVLLPQAGPISSVQMRSRAFVKTVNDVTFEDGLLKTWNAERPSEVMEVVRLPVKAAKAIVSVPAEILSLKVDYSSKAKSLADAEVAQLQAANALAAIKRCVADAVDPATAVNCFPAGK